MAVIFTLRKKNISKENFDFSYPKKYCDFRTFCIHVILSENWNMLLPLNGML